MRKIFTFLFAALMSVGMFAATEVTITQNDFPASGQSFTKDGVTVSAYAIDGQEGNIMRGGSFSTNLGNFTQIEVTAADVHTMSGDGWSGSGNMQKKTWTGNASSVSFSGNIMGMGQGTTLKFTIEEPTVAVTGVTLNQNEAQMTVGGETLTLTATVNPNNATDQSVSWSTSDANVATVENGVVTAVAAGNATITVTTTDGSFTATCAVTVTAPEPQPAGQVITWDFFFCNEVTAMCDDGATIALDNSKDGISVTYGGYDDMDGWGGGYIYLYGASESKMIFSSTVGDISKIEIYYSDNIGGTPADWTVDATNNKFVWEGTPAASVDMKKGSADNIGFMVDHIVFTIGAAAPTAVENVQTNQVQATKFFRDGQLLIEKNGKIYNATGAEVK